MADVLLVHPVETAWSFSENYFSEEKGVQNAPWDPRVVETDQVYSDAMRKMNQEKKNNEVLAPLFCQKTGICGLV